MTRTFSPSDCNYDYSLSARVARKLSDLEKKITLELVRDLRSSLRTLGTLSTSDIPLPTLYTLEPPWRDNKRGASCIPPGEYRCLEWRSKRFGDTFIVCAVPGGRDGILFHVGNSEKDTSGCILLGLERTHRSLIWSRRAMEQFRDALAGVDSFVLRVSSG